MFCVAVFCFLIITITCMVNELFSRVFMSNWQWQILKFQALIVFFKDMVVFLVLFNSMIETVMREGRDKCET